MLNHLRDPVVRESCLYDGAAGIIRGFYATFVIVMAIRQFGWDGETGIELLVIEGASYVAVLLVGGGLVGRLGNRRADSTGHALTLAGLLLLATANGFSLLATGAVLQALGLAVNHLVNVQRLSEQSGNLGHVSGLFTMVGMAGTCAGASLGGLFADLMTLQHVFLIWMVLWLSANPHTLRWARMLRLRLKTC